MSLSKISHAKSLILGLTWLILLGGIILLTRPLLSDLLPAGNLAFLLRDGHYLILLQNNTELRASGGFIGSFGEVIVRNGVPGSIKFGTNIYKLDDPFTDSISIPPPAPLSEITGGKWAFRDSNWAADFPEAAAQTLWFYEKETGHLGNPQKLDGVIALTTTVIEEILRLTGPIELSDYATTLTADNFAEVVQLKIEKEYYENRENWPVDEPKTILKDLIPILQERVRQADKRSLLALGFRLLDEKYILLYSNDPLAERLILKRNWGGAVDRTSGSFLYIVNSNIQGLKSSRKVFQRVRYALDRASWQVTLTIEREHTGSGVWPDADNKNWVRVLVPKGAKLLSARFGVTEAAQKIEIGEEAGKTVFGFWLNTRPQETQDATLVYELPSGIDLSPLMVQRQPGANPDKLTVIIDQREVFNNDIYRDTRITF